MKEKIAYLRGLMDGMKLADDDNTRLLRTIADCLDAIADEVEVESARLDIVEESLDGINDELDAYDEVFEALLEDDDEDEKDYEDEEPFIFNEDDEFFPAHPHHPGCRCHGPHGHGPHGHGPHGCCGHHGHHAPWMEDEDEEFDGEDFLDSLNYFTCPTCGEIVPITDDMLENKVDPICPKCNNPIFGADAETEESTDEE